MNVETRKCRVCQKVKPLTSEYFNNRPELKSSPPFRWDCSVCYNAYKRIQPDYFKRKMLQHARNRARLNEREFNITIDDINIPEFCPVLKIKLEHGWDDNRSCPTLERIDNSKGYIKGNILVVSALANRIKNDGTWQEIMQVAKFYKQLEENKHA
jgi:hypothetical protein